MGRISESLKALAATPKKTALALRSRCRADPGEFWHSCLFASFWISLAFFPIGYGFREVMPPLCAVFLALYYRHAWHKSVLARLRVWPLFLCVGAMTILGVLFSIHPWASFLHAGMGVNKAYILPFIAMECARNAREMGRLAWALAFACFWQGLDGLWQAFTGSDFIMGYGHKGRLTGSLGDYTVGNYLALALTPAFGVCLLLRRRLPFSAALFAAFAIFWPAFFLFIKAGSRSGVLALVFALALWTLMRRPEIWKAALPAALGCAAFLILYLRQFAPASVLHDNRWDLWGLAWKVFEAHPWFGCGAGQYNAAFRELGLAPQREAITISHPHDLYLDILCAHGLVGFSLGMIFLFGFLWWGWRAIAPRTRLANMASEAGLHWCLTAWFWLGYAAWLVNGIFGHDFYRIWWLAQAMCSLGIMIGGVVNGPDIKKGAEAPS